MPVGRAQTTSNQTVNDSSATDLGVKSTDPPSMRRYTRFGDQFPDLDDLSQEMRLELLG